MQEPEAKTVSLTIPALPDYVVLARLALAAVATRTTLRPDEVADLKLAITEGASALVFESSPHRLTFSFKLDERLVVDISGPPEVTIDAGERELSHAIIEATVDESLWDGPRLRLVKHLERPPKGALSGGR
jgi:hypothetical protein